MKTRLLKLWREWRNTALFFGLVIVPVKSVLADLNWVPTGSMNPTILEGDLVYVDKAAYDLRVPLTLKRVAEWADPERGDVVVFFSPDDETRMVKRVIGLPGDTLELINNVLVINGQSVDYSPLSSKQSEGLAPQWQERARFAEEGLDGRRHAVMALAGVENPKRSFAPIKIPEGSYFMMGDNRDNSRDSRFYGIVKREQIVGEAKRVLLSFDLNNWLKPRLSRFGEALQ